jgi:signal transduction histidine kinase
VHLSIDNDLAEPGAAAPSPGGGYGVRGMHERADACGGRLHAGASDGYWRIDVELPA